MKEMDGGERRRKGEGGKPYLLVPRLRQRPADRVQTPVDPKICPRTETFDATSGNVFGPLTGGRHWLPPLLFFALLSPSISM